MGEWCHWVWALRSTIPRKAECMQMCKCKSGCAVLGHPTHPPRFTRHLPHPHPPNTHPHPDAHPHAHTHPHAYSFSSCAQRMTRMAHTRTCGRHGAGVAGLPRRPCARVVRQVGVGGGGKGEGGGGGPAACAQGRVQGQRFAWQVEACREDVCSDGGGRGVEAVEGCLAGRCEAVVRVKRGAAKSS